MRQHEYFPAKTSARFNMVIVHGMQEYGQRYRAFAEYLSAQGGNIITFDLPGHGIEKHKDEIGDFGQAGLASAFTDISEFFQSFAHDLPNVLFGHSMGSAIVLRYAEQHQDLSLLILSGLPVNPVWMLELGYQAAKVEQHLRPAKPSVFANVFKGYNRSFKPCNTASDWLSANPDNVQHYIDDPLCGYDICPHYYVEMFGFMRYAFAEKELVKLDPNLKILVIWGAQDPVTGFGKGTRHFVNKLSAMHYKVQTHEYIGMRHEILNELEHQQVYEDVANFIQASLATLD
ncbi:MAG: alpha/beta fold hydrolase [Thiolinea sp.]